jgi:hypothetical protein
MPSAGRGNAEWTALIACARPRSGKGRVVDLPGDVDFEKLVPLAEDHGVTSLVAAALLLLPESRVPAEIRAELLARQRAQHFVTLRMSAELFRLIDRFSAQNIAALLVKGPALAVQAYGDAAMRNYGDLDFLLHQSDIASATRVMMDAGYEPHVPLSAIAAGKIPGQYMFRQREAQLLVELHNDRTMRYYPRPLRIDELFARKTNVSLDGHEVPAPCVEDHLVLICIHGAKHFWERLQWIADVAALVFRQPSMNWDEAARSAQKVGAETMLHAGLRLASSVFQIALPAAIMERVQGDSSAQKISERALAWLPAAGSVGPNLGERALFRMHMRGSWLAGTSYLLRILMSPTEEDWSSNGGEPHRLLHALRRPFRLAKKHASGGKP